MIKVRTEYAPVYNPHNLAVGKIYEATPEDEGYGYRITSDTGTRLYILVGHRAGCAHLDGGQWEVINDNHDGLSAEDFFTYQYMDGYTNDQNGHIPFDTKCPTWDEVIAVYHKVNLDRQ